jgi:ribosome assembly protein 4
MNGDICIWESENGTQIGLTLKGHNKWVTSLSWEPLHLNAKSSLLASSSKDATIRIWDVITFSSVLCFGGHIKSITKVLWGG